MLKVFHIITHLELGGAQKSTLYVLDHLRPDRYAPTLVTAPRGALFPIASGARAYALQVAPGLRRELSLRADLRALWQLWRLLRRARPDLVHTHSPKAGILGRWAARLAGIPTIVHTIHGVPFHTAQSPVMRALYLGLERITAGWTDRFVVISEHDRAASLACGVGRREQYTLIREGIPLAQFEPPSAEARARVRARWGVDPAAPVVGMVAALKRQKAPLDFLRVARLVAREVPAAHFVVAGDGVLRPAVERAITAWGLGRRVRLLGWCRGIEALYQGLDVVVLTSVWEGLPLVLLEAMAAARPIVATRVGAVHEVVEDGVTGFLVRPGDVATLAERIVALLRDPGQAARMGGAGQARLGARWHADRMVRETEALYEELVARPARGWCGGRTGRSAERGMTDNHQGIGALREHRDGAVPHVAAREVGG